MRFTTEELAEIRSAFRQRIARDPARKQPAQRKPKPEPLPRLAFHPDYEDDEILRPIEVAELFAVTTRTVGRWADAGVLPVFRTIGGQRRFQWGKVRRAVTELRVRRSASEPRAAAR
jgi:excisionase family DNA binding protein